MSFTPYRQGGLDGASRETDGWLVNGAAIKATAVIILVQRPATLQSANTTQNRGLDEPFPKIKHLY